MIKYHQTEIKIPLNTLFEFTVWYGELLNT